MRKSEKEEKKMKGRITHRQVKTCTKETQTEEIESFLRPVENMRKERGQLAMPSWAGRVGPAKGSNLLPPLTPTPDNSERSVLVLPEKVLSTGLCPRPVPKPRKTSAREPMARMHTQYQSTTAVDALSVVLSCRPAVGGLPPPLKPTVPTSTLAVDPFLKWSDPDSDKIGVDSLIML